jgi:cyclophilin family peptidyl-prolyl cis-trans isomerase
MPFGRLIQTCFLVLLLSGLVVPQPSLAQQQAPPAEDAADFDPAEWKALLKKKADAVAQMTKISNAYQAASEDERRKLEADFMALRDQFQRTLSPRMVALAPAAFAQNPNDLDAAEIMLQVTFSQNRYWETAKIADTVLKQNPAHPLALNMGGVSEFAQHNFEKSAEMLEAAKQDEVLIPNLGGQYIDRAREYIDHWKVEQEIRQYEAAAAGDQQLPRVLMKTDKGDILLELFENEAPNTVANFVNLVERGYYEGVAFHRVIPGFMAQGGNNPAKPVNYTIKCECYQDNARRHFSGSLSMAKTQQRDSGSTQFYITHLPTPHLNRDDMADEIVHTVFGRVVEGMQAVAAIEEGDRIISAQVVRKRNHDYTPLTLPAGG